MSTASPTEQSDASDLAPLPDGVYCPDCGYDLRGSTSPRCSECGYDLATLRATESQIPWVHRRQIGRIRAYWRTAWQVTFRNKRFCTEAARPVSYADAQRFRWTTAAIAFLTVLATEGLAALGDMDAFAWFEGMAWMLIPVNVAIFLTLAAWTGLPSYFFHPQRLPLALQNRAIALSYYMTAPLGFMPLGLTPFLLWLGLILAIHQEFGPFDAVTPYLWLGLSLVLSLLVWWFNVGRLARAVVRWPPTRLKIMVLVPALWLVTAGLILVGVPALTFYVVAIFYTWR